MFHDNGKLQTKNPLGTGTPMEDLTEAHDIHMRTAYLLSHRTSLQ